MDVALRVGGDGIRRHPRYRRYTLTPETHAEVVFSVVPSPDPDHQAITLDHGNQRRYLRVDGLKPVGVGRETFVGDGVIVEQGVGVTSGDGGLDAEDDHRRVLTRGVAPRPMDDLLPGPLAGLT